MACRILFAGGCHIEGYLVGENAGFVSEALRLLASLGWQVEAATLAGLPLTHAERLIKLCTEFKPELLLLQLGNWETMHVTFRDYLRRKGQARTSWGAVQVGLIDFLGTVVFGRQPKSSSAAVPPKGAHSSPSSPVGPRWYVWSRSRRLLDLVLGHPLLNLEQTENLIRIFFAQVAALNIPAVLVLSPLPCLDPTHRFYRRKLLSIFQVEAKKNGFAYLDAFSCLVSQAHTDHLFEDADHLNVAGHQWLGQIVGQWIHSVISSRTKTMPK